MNQPYAQFSPAPRTSTMAIISLIAGITGWTILPYLGAIVAVITGHMAHSEIKKSGGMITGKGMATIGLILGYVMLALGICLVCIFVLAFTGAITLPFAIPFFTPSSNTGY